MSSQSVLASRRNAKRRRFDFVEEQARPQFSPTVQQTDFSSVTKATHRYRILCDMQRFVANTSSTPSLLYLASPSGSDSEFFQKAIDSKDLPINTRLAAVNCGEIAVSDCPTKFKNVAFHPHTDIEDFVKTTRDTFSHVWLDLTCTEMPTEMLFRLHSVLKSPVGRDAVYVTLSKRCRTLDAQLKIASAVGDATGFKITHMEDYTGTTQTATLSAKRNMLFLACAQSTAGSANHAKRFDENLNAVGCIAYIARQERPHDTMIWRSKRGSVDANVAFVRRFVKSKNAFVCSLFDTKGTLSEATETVSCTDVLKTAIWLPRMIKHLP